MKLMGFSGQSMRHEMQRLNGEQQKVRERIQDNQEKIKLNKQLPYLVGNIVEILELDANDDAEDDGANIDLDAHRKGKSAVIKTSTRQTVFLPVIGLVDSDKLKPGDLVGVNKDSFLVLDTLPAEYALSFTLCPLLHSMPSPCCPLSFSCCCHVPTVLSYDSSVRSRSSPLIITPITLLPLSLLLIPYYYYTYHSTYSTYLLLLLLHLLLHLPLHLLLHYYTYYST